MSRKLAVLADRAPNVPSRNRLDPGNRHHAAILAAHDEALRNNKDGYIDPVNSLFVITAATHSTRGYCCDNNCRHCPYTD